MVHHLPNPLALASEAQAGLTALDAPATAAPPRQRPRLLAVDDMASMLEFARVFLSAAGYEVLVAGDGAEAIALLEREGGGVEGMITDYRLPDCNGLDLIQEVRGRWPHIRCLLTSGYIPEDETARIEGELGVGLLSKPYGARDALAAVGRLLEAAPEGPVLPTRRDSAG